jgi:hypothetical protein
MADPFTPANSHSNGYPRVRPGKRASASRIVGYGRLRKDLHASGPRPLREETLQARVCDQERTQQEYDSAFLPRYASSSTQRSEVDAEAPSRTEEAIALALCIGLLLGLAVLGYSGLHSRL